MQDVTLIERVCGICSHVHTTTFCRGVETIAGIEVPPRAVLHPDRCCASSSACTRICCGRALAARVHRLPVALHGDVPAARAGHGSARVDLRQPGALRHELHRRRQPRHRRPGRRDCGTGRDRRTILQRDLVPSFMESRTAMSRMRGVGVLTRDAGDRVGRGRTRGARFRASRPTCGADLPYGAYAELGFQMVTQAGGDVLARVAVRALELLESMRLSGLRAARLPDGPVRAFEGVPRIPPGEATAWAEAPRGEVIYYVASDGGDAPARVKIRTPSFVNIPAIEAMTVGAAVRRHAADPGLGGSVPVVHGPVAHDGQADVTGGAMRADRLPQVGEARSVRGLPARWPSSRASARSARRADLLARAGRRHAALVDRDFVERSNLQRQCLYDEQDAARSLPKAEAAVRALEAHQLRDPLRADRRGHQRRQRRADHRRRDGAGGRPRWLPRPRARQRSLRQARHADGCTARGWRRTAARRPSSPGVSACLHCVMPTTVARGAAAAHLRDRRRSRAGDFARRAPGRRREALKIMVGGATDACRRTRALRALAERGDHDARGRRVPDCKCASSADFRAARAPASA